jgi:hypothetical protein
VINPAALRFARGDPRYASPREAAPAAILDHAARLGPDCSIVFTDALDTGALGVDARDRACFEACPAFAAVRGAPRLDAALLAAVEAARALRASRSPGGARGWAEPPACRARRMPQADAPANGRAGVRARRRTGAQAMASPPGRRSGGGRSGCGARATGPTKAKSPLQRRKSAGIAGQCAPMTETANSALSLLSRDDDAPPVARTVDAPMSGFMLGAGAFAALLLAAPRLVAAEPVSPLTQGLLGVPANDATPLAQRFSTPDGALRFTLDRSGEMALMRFDGRPEVLALTPVSGPRGDEYLKTDTGRVVLRVNAMGGVTVYAGASESGAAASAAGRATPLAGPAPPPGGLTARLSEIERATGRALGRPISFDAPPGGTLTSGAAVGLVADAAERVAEGLAARKPTRVARVVIQFGSHPEARLEQDALRVTIAPQLGYAGRPSVDAVEAALSR